MHKMLFPIQIFPPVAKQIITKIMRTRIQRIAQFRALYLSLFFNCLQIQGYEFEIVIPESVGYDSSKLALAQEKADSLYEDGRIPNYVLALYKDGKRFFLANRGLTELKNGVAVDTETIYHLASMSKPIVTTAIFRLVQDGKLSLTDKLSKFYPEFSDMMVAPEGDFKNQFERAAREINILDLVTHTSGFTYSENITGFGDVGRTYEELGIFQGKIGKTMEQHMMTLSEVPLIAQPGKEFNYSVSADVLGAIIEKVTGKSLAVYLDEVIFSPLGMMSTRFELNSAEVKRMSHIYAGGDASMFGGKPSDTAAIGKIERSGENINWKIFEFLAPHAFSDKPTFYSGGGGLLSSANDYARYLSMIAGDGQVDEITILEPNLAKLHKKQLVDLPPGAFRRAFGDAAEYMTFGGGFGVKRDPSDSTKIDYIFWAGAFNTFFWLDLSDDSIGIFFTAHWPVKYNISDSIEQIVDEARL